MAGTYEDYSMFCNVRQPLQALALPRGQPAHRHLLPDIRVVLHAVFGGERGGAWGFINCALTVLREGDGGRALDAQRHERVFAVRAADVAGGGDLRRIE